VLDCTSLSFALLPSTLIVLPTQLDLNPVAWASSSVAAPGSDDSLALKDALDNVLVLCNAHLALRHENEIAVFAAGPGSRCVARLLFLLPLSFSERERTSTDPAVSAISRQLFSSHLFHSSSSSAPAASSSTNHDSNIYQQFRIVDDQLAKGVKEMMADFPEEADGGVNLVGALSMALCRAFLLHTLSPCPTARRHQPPFQHFRPFFRFSLVSSNRPGTKSEAADRCPLCHPRRERTICADHELHLHCSKIGELLVFLSPSASFRTLKTFPSLTEHPNRRTEGLWHRRRLPTASLPSHFRFLLPAQSTSWTLAVPPRAFPLFPSSPPSQLLTSSFIPADGIPPRPLCRPQPQSPLPTSSRSPSSLFLPPQDRRYRLRLLSLSL
jgi:hypothetical protein